MSVSTPAWRLIDTGPLNGPLNMAIDEALLTCFEPERSLPTLRLYGWDPPAFSLGKFQKAVDIFDPERHAPPGFPVVRRVTGGGCIFHGEELTYSIVCAPGHLEGTTGVKESYRLLCGFLLRAYRHIGLSPSFAVDTMPKGAHLGRRTPLCFAGMEEYDIMANGRKLGGNAQRRTRGLIFQHGSIPLRDTLSTAAPFLRKEVASTVTGGASLEELGVLKSAEQLKGHLVDSFKEHLGVDLVKGNLSARERAVAELLLNTKYLGEAWNLEGREP